MEPVGWILTNSADAHFWPLNANSSNIGVWGKFFQPQDKLSQPLGNKTFRNPSDFKIPHSAFSSVTFLLVFLFRFVFYSLLSLYLTPYAPLFPYDPHFHLCFMFTHPPSSVLFDDFPAMPTILSQQLCNVHIPVHPCFRNVQPPFLGSLRRGFERNQNPGVSPALDRGLTEHHDIPKPVGLPSFPQPSTKRHPFTTRRDKAQRAFHRTFVLWTALSAPDLHAVDARPPNCGRPIGHTPHFSSPTSSSSPTLAMSDGDGPRDEKQAKM